MNLSEFTRLSPLIKSVRFELEPCGRTREYLDIHNVLSSDIERKQNVEVVNRISDCFIREFIEGLSGNYDWDKLLAVYNLPEYKGEADKMKEQIARDINGQFMEYLHSYAKEHGISCKILFPGASYIEDILPMYASMSSEFSAPDYEQIFNSLRKTSSMLFVGTYTRYTHILFGSKRMSIAGRMLENFTIAVGNKAIYDKYNDIVKFDECAELLSDINCMNECMSQRQIDTYNDLIGGVYNSEGIKIKKGINECINEYNQCNPDSQVPLMRKLYKQILTDREPAYHIGTIESRTEFDEILDELKERGNKCFDELSVIIAKLAGEYDGNNVYISCKARREISEKLCGSWNYIDGVLEQAEILRIREEYYNAKGKIKTKLTQKEEKKVHSDVAMHISSMSEIDAILSDVGTSSVAAYVSDMFDDLVRRRDTAYNDVMKCTFWHSDKKPQWAENESIQRYIGCIIEAASMVPLFIVDAAVVEADVDMRERIENLDDVRHSIIRLYNLIRNYLTQKTDEEAKKKSTVLMFGRSAHLNQSWITSTEGRFGNLDAAILEADGRYYYMVSGATKQKLNIPMLEVSDIVEGAEYYNCLYTKTNGHLAMMLPKCTFASKPAKGQYELHEYDELFDIPVGSTTMSVSKKMYDDYNAKIFRSDKDARNALINYAKDFISKYDSYMYYDFSGLKPTEEYSSYGEFCDEVDSITFRTERRFIERSLIDKAVNNGSVYLFMIKNQDMYKADGRCKDKTSLRFRAIIDSMCSGDTSIIINNSPLIQYRPAVIEPKITHPVGSILVNKLTSDGAKIPEEIYHELYEYYNNRIDRLSDAAVSYKDKAVVKRADFDHIRARHYGREMFTITLSYTINKGVTSATTGYGMNRYVNERLKTQGYNILTVIRGVDNLLYYYLSDADGNRISGGNLNCVGNVNYKERLKALGTERVEKQRKWNYSMDKVASVKEAYLNEVCRVIVSFAIENNAVIVVDQINGNSKNRAAAFDDNVYNKFETKLIAALSDCANINIPATQEGGIINPYQLASTGIKGCQNGIAFFVFNMMTRNICPDTGFVNVYDYKACTLAAKKACLEQMKIYYDKEIGEFRYEFSFGRIGNYFRGDAPRTIDKVWSIRTHLTRYVYDAAAHSYKELNGTTLLLDYAARNQISLDRAIDVTELDNEGIRLLYEVFVSYVNGFVYRDSGSYYISPVTGWCSIGSDYDELTAHYTAVKAGIMIKRILGEATGKDAVVTGSQWYDILTETNREIDIV